MIPLEAIMPRAKGKRLTAIEQQAIISAYLEGKSTTSIQKELGCGAGTIYSVLDKHNIPRRKRAAEYGKCKRRNFFASIDSEAKAYYLGLLIADGSVSGKTRITITLQEEDKHILESFAKVLGMAPKEVKYQKPHGKAGPQARLSFCSRSMREDLARYGVVPNKTHKTFLPDLDTYLMPHLIRGIFDGDGHVSKYIAYISGSLLMCQQLNTYLSSLDIPTYLYRQEDTGVWYAKGEGREGRTRFLQYIYTNACYFLKRKNRTALETHLLIAPLISDGESKFRELLENPEEGNQQPSLGSDPSEGSTTSSNGLFETMKDHERGTPIGFTIWETYGFTRI